MLALLGMLKMTGVFLIFPPHLHKKVTCIKFISFLSLILVNLRKRAGEERRRQTLFDKRDNNFV